MALSSQELTQLANLAKLDMTNLNIDQLQNKIDYFLTLANQLSEVNINDIQPLTHPLDMQQRLRNDEASSTYDSKIHQDLTKHVRDNLYVVPTVLDSSN